jgi:two-component system response regulator CiaR
MKVKILLVEDDVSIRETLTESLTAERYEVDAVSHGRDAHMMGARDIYDLILLDIMLPGMDGFSILREWRREGLRTPVICITARDGLPDRIHGLDLGADDYLVKPFAVSELMARVRAVARRGSASGSAEVLTCGDLRMAPRDGLAWFRDQPLDLTAKEFALLEFLLYNQGRILPRDVILERVWGLHTEAAASIVDVYVHYVRKKLTAAGMDVSIETKRGMGYLLRRVP